MTTDEVKAFFDRLAPSWDADMIRSDEIIGTILDNGGVREGSHVLDVGCGTGVLVPDYLARKVGSVLGVDISDEMLRIARSKFSQPEISFLCADASVHSFDRQFDAIVIYNAFPHFPEPEPVIAHLSECLKPGGFLTVAHGMSRDRINAHHQGTAKHVSRGLMELDELVAMFSRYLEVTTAISDPTMYQVAGRKR